MKLRIFELLKDSHLAGSDELDTIPERQRFGRALSSINLSADQRSKMGELRAKLHKPPETGSQVIGHYSLHGKPYSQSKG